MPFQSRAQIIGDAGELWFQSQIPPGWLFQKPTKDVGIDGVVVICERSHLNGKEFRVQIKASEQLKVKDSKIILDKSKVKSSTIDYWFISPLPTMIVVYDYTTKRGYYCWHNELYEQVSKLQGKDTPSDVVLRIPERELTPESWNDIRQDLTWHSKNLKKSLDDARNAKSVLPTIHSIAAGVRQLNSIDHQPIPNEVRTQQQEGLLAMMEMFIHRDIITALSNLLSDLHPDCDGAKQLQEWISSYHQTVISVFRSFDELPEDDVIPPDYQLVYARNLIHKIRPQLMQSALEMIMRLTPDYRPEKDSKTGV